MNIIEQIRKKIKLYKINIEKLFSDLEMNNKLMDFILNSTTNKLKPEYSKVVEITLKEIDNKIAESK